MKKADLVLRGGSIMGGPTADIAITDGRIAQIGRIAPTDREYDIRGTVVLPGLIDHHIHLFATAARDHSCDLSCLKTTQEIVNALRDFAAGLPAGAPLRATGLDCIDGPPDRGDLTAWLPGRPLRIQDRTGALWLCNDAMLAMLGIAEPSNGPFPECVERDRDNASTGRIWRGDTWLRERLGKAIPNLATLAARLAAFGITGVTDTSPANGPEEAAIFERLIERQDWPLRLQLMGNERLPASTRYRQGPLKLHYDERDLPPLDEVIMRISCARSQGRAVAAHCATEGELAWYLAALDAAGGSEAGDRVEHGAIIPDSFAREVASRGLMVVSQPAFIRMHGKRYLREVEAKAVDLLYRLRGLQQHGIGLAAGSDAPYGPLDPWLAIRAAIDRRAQDGPVIGPQESLSSQAALAMFLHPFDVALAPRSVAACALADLTIVEGSWNDLLDDPRAERVRLTLVGGVPVFQRA